MIDAAINKASALVEALSYIQRFHNKVVVVIWSKENHMPSITN